MSTSSNLHKIVWKFFSNEWFTKRKRRKNTLGLFKTLFEKFMQLFHTYSLFFIFNFSLCFLINLFSTEYFSSSHKTWSTLGLFLVASQKLRSSRQGDIIQKWPHWKIYCSEIRNRISFSESEHCNQSQRIWIIKNRNIYNSNTYSQSFSNFQCDSLLLGSSN